MTHHRFELGLGALLLAFVAAVFLWQNPGVLGAKIRQDEVARYAAALEKLPFPAEYRTELLARARRWMETDDGKPVYMLNLMRFYQELRKFPGAIDFQGTPQESNATYEQAVMPMVFRLGGYPAYAGTSRAGNLIEFAPQLDRWDRVLVVRYPNRRAFLDLVTNPDYREIEPYKLMALQVVLTPTAAEMAIPDLTWLAAGLALTIFLAAGWWRASRRS